LLAVLSLSAVILWRAPHTEGANLLFRADALDYAVVANRLAALEPPTIPIGDREYPSRYPVGFPLLLVPAVEAGVPPHELWIVSALTAVLGVGLTYLATVRITNRLLATWAAGLLALAPVYIRFGLMVMSDVPAAALTAAWALSLFTRSWLAVGLIAGFACGVRLTGALLLGASAFGAIRDKRCSRFVMGAALGLLPVVVCTGAGWSGPFAGYAYWMPGEYGTLVRPFGVAPLLANVAGYTAAFLGLAHRPAFYSFPVALLALLGVFSKRLRRTTVVLVVLAIGCHLGIVLPYFFHDLRLVLPIVPLVLILAALGLKSLWERLPLAAGALAACLIAFQWRDARHSLGTGPPTVRVGAALVTVASYLPPEALVISDVASPLVWLYWERGTAREFLPLSVPPAGFRSDVFLDRHLRRLYWNAAAGSRMSLPTTLLDQGGVTATGRTVIERHERSGSPVIAVVCTKRGRRDLAGARLPVRPLVPIGTTSPCDIFRLSAREAAIRGARGIAPQLGCGDRALDRYRSRVSGERSYISSTASSVPIASSAAVCPRPATCSLQLPSGARRLVSIRRSRCETRTYA